VFALVHAQTTRTTTEAIALGTEFAAIALFAEQFTGVFRTVHAVQLLTAETALEAGFVPLGASGEHLLGGIDGLAALGALGLFNGLERHV